jgi:hypothetical protein
MLFLMLCLFFFSHSSFYPLNTRRRPLASPKYNVASHDALVIFFFHTHTLSFFVVKPKISDVPWFSLAFFFFARRPFWPTQPTVFSDIRARSFFFLYYLSPFCYMHDGLLLCYFFPLSATILPQTAYDAPLSLSRPVFSLSLLYFSFSFLLEVTYKYKPSFPPPM